MGEAADEIRAASDLERSNVGTSTSTVAPLGGENLEATQIRSGIEKTRASLSETIDALQDKLDPGRIAEQVKDQIREKATEAYDTAKEAVKEATIGRAGKIVSSVSEAVTDMTGRAGTAVSESSSSVVQYIRDNPVPFAMVGLGLGMLALSKRQAGPSASPSPMPNRPSGIAETARGAATTVADSARSAASTISDAAGSVTDTARQQFHDVSQQARQGARLATERYQSTMDESPMVVGLAVLAAGALVGLALPTTRVESEYMGEARDRLVDQAKSVAQDAASKVQRVAEEAGHTVKEAIQKEGLVGSQT